MKLNQGFQHWNRPYLFQDIEDIILSMSETDRKNVISLGIGDPDLPTPSAIREAIIREHNSKYYGYPSVQGRQDLREAIAQYYLDRFKVTVHPEEICVGMGAKTDLFDLSGVFANPGDYVSILDPAYPVYLDSALYRGLQVIYLRGNPANNYMPPLDESNIPMGKLALIYMCYPNNPTGAMGTKKYVSQMIELAKKHRAMIIFDIAYADFVPGNTVSNAFSIFNLEEASECGIEVGSFSKPFSRP